VTDHIGASGRAARPALVVALLGLSQIVGYGTLYYSFSILADQIGKGVGWPISWIYGAFSVGLFASGMVAPHVGRQVDQRGAPLIMSIGSVATAAMLIIAGVAPNGVVLAAAVIAMQAAAAMVLYDVAFAALVQVSGRDARRQITHLTLIAGFSSSLFWPLTTWLHGVLDWRATLFAFAAGNLLICLPIHLWLLRQRERPLPVAGGNTLAAEIVHTPLSSERQKRGLWLATLAFALSGFALSAMLTQMVPLLTALGIGSAALFVSTLFGPSQFLMRLTNLLLGAKRHPLTATLLALTLLPLAMAILALSAPWTVGAVLFALLLGFGSGLKSIVQGTLPLALFGAQGYGARLGFMSSVRQALAAVAPFALAFATEHVGPVAALWAVTLVGVAGLVCGVLVALEVRR